MKKFVSLVLALVLALSMTACGQTRGDDPAPVEDIPTEKVTIRLGGLKGPTSMGMVKLLADAEEGLTANDYTFTMAASAPDLTPQFVKGELDILAVPVNLGATLYANTDGGVMLLAASTLGVLYIVERGDTVLVALPGCLDENGLIANLSATEQRQVTLGRNDDNYIEIVDGLEEGDVVVALSPQGSSIMSAMGME